MKTIGNDSAYPVKAHNRSDLEPGAATPTSRYIETASGVTKRELFAKDMLNGLLSYSCINPVSGNYHENCTYAFAAQTAVKYADALIEALNAENT